MNAATGLPDWAHYLGSPSARGVIRSAQEDFRVWEVPIVSPSGEGNHLWLEIEKRGANTDWVAGRLAALAGAPRRDVGFAGMKDRHGVTTQWFSVGLQEADNDDWPSWRIEGVTVLQAERHGRKLRRGTLAGNRFRIVVRELDGDRAELQDRIDRLAGDGFPNYFGPQRFGHGGRNVERARRWLLSGGRVKRAQRGLFLSAARSLLFNRVLSARIGQDSWNRLLDGEQAILDGRRPVFTCELPDPELERRSAALEIHPTGPLPGRGPSGVERAAAQCESAALAGEEGLVEALAAAGVESARRSLRGVPRGLSAAFDGDALVLDFTLAAGSFATSLLRELVSVQDASTFRLKGSE
jgi:tRNA pseudouridine13 synthase